MIYAFTIICALIPGAEGAGNCKVDAYLPSQQYTDTTLCSKDMAKALSGSPENYNEKQLDMTKGIYFNYGCVNYPSNPEDDMQSFSDRIFKLYGPFAVKDDA